MNPTVKPTGFNNLYVQRLGQVFTCPENEAPLQRVKFSREDLGDWMLFICYLPTQLPRQYDIVHKLNRGHTEVSKVHAKVNIENMLWSKY